MKVGDVMKFAITFDRTTSGCFAEMYFLKWCMLNEYVPEFSDKPGEIIVTIPDNDKKYFLGVYPEAMRR